MTAPDMSRGLAPGHVPRVENVWGDAPGDPG